MVVEVIPQRIKKLNYKRDWRKSKKNIKETSIQKKEEVWFVQRERDNFIETLRISEKKAQKV